MGDPSYIPPPVPEQSRIHVDGVSRRRADGHPSIDAMYERSRPHMVTDHHSHSSSPSHHRSSRHMPNGGTHGTHGTHDYQGSPTRRSTEHYESSRRSTEGYEGRPAGMSHHNQVHPVEAGTRGERGDRGERGERHDSRRQYEREQNGGGYYGGSARSPRDDESRYGDDYDGEEKYVVPTLPMCVAIVCCVLNFILPGFGSMLAGFCVLCCGRTDGMSCKEKCSSCGTVFGIGVLQLLLVACFLIGWIWSCIWGITFISMAMYDDEYDDYDEDYPEGMQRRRHVPTGNTPLPTPEVVVDQPYPGVRYEDLHGDNRSERRGRSRGRRTISRISLTPSNFIYPMRAPSSIHYSSPPPAYTEHATPPPAYWRNTPRNTPRNNSQGAGRREGNSRHQQTPTIYEEHGGRR